MPDSVQKQVEDSLVTTISSLITSAGLTWPKASEVVARRLPWDEQGDGTVIIHRGITVYPVPTTEAPGTNEREDQGYGVGIAFIAPVDSATSMLRDQVHAAKEAIRRKIYHDVISITLTGGLYLQTKVVNQEVNIPKAKHRYEVSGLMVRCWVREPRT